MKLNTPGKIGSIELKNRIVMAPMGLHYPGGFTKEVAEFYKERAKGGAGLILVACTIEDAFEDASASMCFTDENKHMLKDLCDTAHKYNCKVGLQIVLGTGRIGGPSEQYGVPCSASAIPTLWDPNTICHELTKAEIEILKKSYRHSVEIGFECGADVVETHSYGGYLLDQFLTKRWNKRTDEYGGDLDGRMRLLKETIDIIREVSCGKMGIICKITPDHLMPVEGGWRGMDEGIQMAKKLEAYGVDALHICAGCYENWENGMPGTYFQGVVPHVRSAEIIRKNVSIPVIAHGRLNHVSKASYALENSKIDFVGIARGHLADPEIGNKLMSGKTDEITPCISCNEGCIGHVMQGQHVTCAVNPRCGFETERILKPAANPRKILIIGAGPGGCSAAIYAKQCGHDVEIWERGDHIGGNAMAASMPVFKRDMESLISYYKHKIDIMGIRIKFLTEATPETVAQYAPDHMIWAAGGIPVCPKSIPGIAGDNVCLATDALENRAFLGDRIVVIGGGMVGCEAAAHFALLGKEVSIVEMAPAVLQEDIFVQSRIMLTKWMEISKLTKYEETRLVSIQEHEITVEKDGSQFQLPCDTVVLAMGFQPNTDELKKYEKICPATAIGDALKLGRILNATADAFNAVMALEH